MSRQNAARSEHTAIPLVDQTAGALAVLRESGQLLLTAERLDDGLLGVLERVCPLVNAGFASVFLVDGDHDMMRLAAAFNWPERVRPWLGSLRVRVGHGPSGEAARDRRIIEVPDVFEDDAVAEWREVAAELGFRALVAVPLAAGAHVLGAATFYFPGGGGFTSVQRDVLRIAADQMSLAALRAALADRARTTSAKLADAETELERQRVVAIEAGRARDEFLANISHELRTPLTVVLGTIDLMTEELGGPLTASQREDLERAREASDRLLGVIEALLALSALRRGTLTVSREEFDPRVAIEDAAKAAGAPQPGVEFVVEEPGTFVPNMHGDLQKTVRVLSILLSNAFRFTVDGRVTASLDVGGGRVRYRVSDTGIGIPADAQLRVFEEFLQVDGSVTRKFGGAGLGLPLARGLARLLGGDVTMESVHGTGSTFTVELPLKHD